MIYQTQEQLQAEARVLQCLCRRWHCSSVKRDALQGLDALLSWDQPFAYCEAKCRDIPFGFRASSGEGFNVSMLKVRHARRAWAEEQLPTMLAIQFEDGIIHVYFGLHRWQGRQIVWGRSDRPGDASAIEPTAVIPWDGWMRIEG